ncbi:hypothetical protein C8Q79DRAFT_957325 [Trametes meyenii]|nr:hypothetical protein C8Q79DRAFT_957325 [Trametes meyenii]
MFLLPFVFAGFFMLSVLNPHYTATLLSQVIPGQVRLLSRAFSPVSAYLASSTLRLSGFSWPSLPLGSLVPHFLHAALSGATLTVDSRYAPANKLTLCGSSNTTWHGTPGHDENCFSGTPQPSYEPAEGLELLILFLVLCLLWSGCGFTDKFRVPQSLSSAASVEDLLVKPQIQAFTSGNTFELDELFADDVTEEDGPIPAQLEFVTPGSSEVENGSSFIVNTRGAVDTIAALPLRVCFPSSESLRSIDDLEEQDVAVSPAATLNGIHRLFAQSARGLATPHTLHSPRDEGVPSSSEAFVTRSTEQAVMHNAPLRDLPGTSFEQAQDANEHVGPRTRSQSNRPSLPAAEDLFTSAPVHNSNDRTLRAPRPVSGHARAFFEQARSVRFYTPPNTNGEPSMANHAMRVPQHLPRGNNPPTRVYPRITEEMRRSRAPTFRPVQTTSNSGTWEQVRRIRTISGV